MDASRKRPNAADEHDPDFYGLLDLAMTQRQVDAFDALRGLVWMASAEHKVH